MEPVPPYFRGVKLATALVEHETLDADEVRKVVKGEQIRNIQEVLKEELSAPLPSDNDRKLDKS